jgi:hypothetical protein
MTSPHQPVEIGIIGVHLEKGQLWREGRASSQTSRNLRNEAQN